MRKKRTNVLEDKFINYNSEDLHDHRGIAAVIMNEDGKFLVLEHKKYNFLTIPIGKVKPDQTIVEGLKTELKEELGIDITDYYEIGYLTKTYKRNKLDVLVEITIFRIVKWNGIIKNAEPNKHDRILWMNIGDIIEKDNLSDSTIEWLKLVYRIFYTHHNEA